MGLPAKFSQWFFTVVVTVLLSACGSGSSSGSSSEPPASGTTAPELSSLSTAAITFVDLPSGSSGSSQISFSNSGNAALTYELTTSLAAISLPANSSGSVAPGANIELTLDITCGNVDLSGSVVLETNDSDEASTEIPVTASCVPLAGAFEVARVLMNQAARAFDSDVSATPTIGILANREMVVRAFVTGNGTPPEARVVVERSGQPNQTFAMQVPPSVGATPASDTTLNASHYAILPGSAIQEGASIRIEVEPFATPTVFPATGNIDLSASDPGEIRITFVPVTFEGQTPSINPTTYMRQALRVLPIGEFDVQVRAPYTFTDDYDLGDLLMDIADLRQLDGSDRLYHAVIIPPNSSTSTTAGVGYVGFPVSVSIDLSGAGYIIAHEMGHNLNLSHAPGCGAPNGDPDFPNANAEVTTWGYDNLNNSLVAPTATKRDFMSYCNDLWTTDYHFDRAIDHRNRSRIGFGPEVSQGLSISGRLSNDELVDIRMLPTNHVYMSAEAGEVNHEYQFVAWDHNGAELISQTFNVHRVEDVDNADAFLLSVPMPVSPIDHYEVRHLGQIMVANSYTAVTSDSEVQLSWRDQTAHVDWSPIAGEALVVRDVAGEVIAIDRTGGFQLLGAENFTIELATRGQRSSRMSAIVGSDRRMRVAR